MSVKDKRRSIKQKLQRVGFAPEDYNSDSIKFLSGETFFVLQLYENANDYYRLLLPNFYKVNNKFVDKILQIINFINCQYRCIKILYLHEELWVSAEIFFESEELFIKKLNDLIRISKASALEVLDSINKELS